MKPEMTEAQKLANTRLTNTRLNMLDRVAGMLQEKYADLGLPFEEARGMVQHLDGIADAIEETAFGKASFEMRKAEVLQRESDEPYVETYKNPMAPIQIESDEPYMKAYADDQSSAVIHGKAETGTSACTGAHVIDYWALAGDYKPGQSVQQVALGFGNLSLSPFIGRVTAVHKGTGFVDVQWPYGNERMSPEDLVQVNPQLALYLPPTLNQTYSSYDTQQTKVASKWRMLEVPPTFYRDLARMWSKGASDLEAYDVLWQTHGSAYSDDALRSEVKQFYQVASNLAELRVQQHAVKTAAYWVAQNRTYRVTSEEFDSKKPICPKCGTRLKKTTYKMDKGSRVRLFGCPKDLFLVKREDLLGPGGEPVEW